MRLWIGLSLALTMAIGHEAEAADWYTGAAGDAPAEQTAPVAAIDIAIDATTRESIAGAMIGTIAPFAPLDETGVRLRASGVVGTYVYNAGGAIATGAGLGRVHGTLEDGSFLVGYEWVWKKASVAIYAGAEVMNNSISPNDPNNTVKGTRGGVKIGSDVYVNPTDNTMASAVAYYSSNFNAYYARLKFGYAVMDHVYVGPEVLALGDNFFSQWRAGAHISGIRFGMVQFGVSGGFLHDRVRGTGAYGILESRVTF